MCQGPTSALGDGWARWPSGYPRDTRHWQLTQRGDRVPGCQERFRRCMGGDYPTSRHCLHPRVPRAGFNSTLDLCL